MDINGENSWVLTLAFPGALRGGDVFSSLLASCDWLKKGIVPHSVVGSPTFCVFLPVLTWSQTGERCWSLLTGLWRAVAPLMKPWCTEGVLPTAANLNLYRGRFSRVAWHSDNEPLFGERGEPKLSVSMKFGTRARFKWKGESCPDGDAGSCWLERGGLLVTDG